MRRRSLAAFPWSAGSTSLVRHASQGLGVIDLKWTRSANRRRTELAEGRALQLATYGAIADPTGGDPAPGAYYLLNQRRLLGPVGAIVAEEEIETSRSLADTWTDLVETWRLWRDLAAQGAVLGTGLPEAADHFPAGLGITPGRTPADTANSHAFAASPKRRTDHGRPQN